MSKATPLHSWEEWQLTAYLLDELDPDVAQRIAAAAVVDAELAQQLKELSSTLDDVRAVLEQEPQRAALPEALSSSDRQLLHKMSDAFTRSVSNSDHSVSLSKSAAHGHSKSNQGQLSARWQNWLTLTAVLVTAVVLWRGQDRPARQSATQLATRETVTSTVGPLVTKDGQGQSQEIELVQRAQENVVSENTVPGNSKLDVLTTDLAPTQTLGVPAPDAQPQATTGTVSTLAKDRAPSLPSTLRADPTAAPSDAYGGTDYGVAGPAPAEGSIDQSNVRAIRTPGASSAASVAQLSEGDLAETTVVTELETQREAVRGRSSLPSGGLSVGSSPGSTIGSGGAMDGAMGYGGAMIGGAVGSTWDAKGIPSRPWRDQGELYPSLGRNGRQYSRGLRPAPGMMDEPTYFYAQPDGDKFAAVIENSFAKVATDPLSTFSIDVDTASYAKARQYIMEYRQLPPASAVRTEEFINYFDYEYSGPKDDAPFAAALAVTECPWQNGHKLVRIALQAKKVELKDRPKANIVFLLDVSGSMNEPNKLPLVQQSMRMLASQLGENDRVAMVVYAGAAGCVLESTPGNRQDEILGAIDRLSAGGSTNGGQGIELAYNIARSHFIPGGINRVILCTDGDFNVGVTSTEELVKLVENHAKSKVFLTVLGFGMGNTNDEMMEQISDRGNGIYGFVDSHHEAHRQMVKQLAGNLMTVAKDVKIQVEFNPAKVDSYRLIGYENRQLAAQDFNNDKKDAGEIGAGHRVTALYELVPTNSDKPGATAVDPLRYQATRPEPKSATAVAGEVSSELLAVKLRYKQPEGDESQLLTFPLDDRSVAFSEADQDFRWAAAVAEFSLLLRGSQYKGSSSWPAVTERARAAAGSAPEGTRVEFLEMIRIATSLSDH